MTSPSTSFFEAVAEQGHVSWLEHERGRLRFEIADDGRLRRSPVLNDGFELLGIPDRRGHTNAFGRGVPLRRPTRGPLRPTVRPRSTSVIPRARP